MVGREFVLRRGLQQLDGLLERGDGSLDFVLLDCPPSLGYLTANALVAASWVLVPVDTSPMGREAFLDSMSMVRQAHDGINPQLRTLSVLVTSISPRTLFEREVEESLRQQYRDLVFQTVIPHSVRAKEAMEAQRPYDRDHLARMVLEGEGESSGLLGLAESVGEVGLRQPINVYEITDSSYPTSVSYRIAEGERRYWAHWIPVVGGREEFKSIRCVVERGVPGDLEVRVRQLAKNAVRQDLPAMARAWLMLGLKTCVARGFRVEVSPDASLEELGDAVTRARYPG
jgi:hypothetical protein